MEETVPNEGFPDWREAEEAGAAPLFERLFGANENSKQSFTKTGSGQNTSENVRGKEEEKLRPVSAAAQDFELLSRSARRWP